MLELLAAPFLRLALFAAIILVNLSCPSRGAAAQQTRAIDFFHAKDQVDSIEVVHIGHVGVSYRSAILLGDLSSRGMGAQDYVRIQSENWRAVNDLYSALGSTTIDANNRCNEGKPLDVRWAIVVNFLDRSKQIVGLDPLQQNCLQLLSVQGAFPSSRDFLVYVERTFPFMK